MKRLALISIACLIATGCSTTKQGNVESPQVSAIGNQKLSSTFKRQGVKIEWECKLGTGLFGVSDALCVNGEINAIEVNGYAPSFGNSEALREQAFVSAELNAKAKLIRFINETVSTNSFSNTITKNVEKAQDRIKRKISSTEEVAMSDEDANKDINFAERENTNEVIKTLTESIVNNAEGKLRGTYVKDATVVDRQTVKVTIRWDRNSEKAVRILTNAFK